MVALVPLVRGLWWIYLWAFMIEVASLVFLPARDASIPELVDKQDLELANGFVLGSSFGTIPLGAAVFAIVAALPGRELFGRSLATVFWIDAFSFIVSALLLRRLTMLAAASAVRATAVLMSPTRRTCDFATRSGSRSYAPCCPRRPRSRSGLGALFSLGIEFVRTDLHASDAEFGVLVVLFGVGAVLGLGVIQRFRVDDRLRATRLGVAALGLIVAGFSLAPAIRLAFVGAVCFGAAAALTLASGMGLLQSDLDGQERILAFAVFHIVIRAGLALAAISAGVAAQLVGSVHWPVVGTLEPTRLVLLCSGLLVFVASSRVRLAGVNAPNRPPRLHDGPQPEGV